MLVDRKTLRSIIATKWEILKNGGMNGMKKIAVFFAQGFEEIEALTVVDGCRRAGIEVVMTGVDNGKTCTGSHGIEVTLDAALEEMNFDELDMIVLPGGMPGTKNLEKCDLLMKQVDEFYQNGKWIAAICAAPSIFGHRNILAGKKACCYPGFEGELTGAQVTDRPVECDGNVITSRGMGCAIEFTLKIIEVLVSKEKADEIATGIIYK